MRNLIALLIVVLLGICVPSRSFAQAGQMWYCWDSSHNTHLYYLSGTFGPAQDIMSQDSGDISQVWSSEFDAYIFRTYGEHGSASCNRYDTTSKLEADQKLGEQQFSAQLHGKYLRTGWLPTHLQ